MARAAALSDEDVTFLANQFDAAPAGGGFAELILITFITWVVIHATDTFDFLFPEEEEGQKAGQQ